MTPMAAQPATVPAPAVASTAPSTRRHLSATPTTGPLPVTYANVIAYQSQWRRWQDRSGRRRSRQVSGMSPTPTTSPIRVDGVDDRSTRVIGAA